MIQTAEGEKRIEDVREGDLVLSSNPERSDTASKPEAKLVTRSFERTAHELFEIRIDNTTITATAEHPFWVVGAGWTAAGELRRGSALLTKDGVVVHVDTIERREGKFKVYNFEVAGNPPTMSQDRASSFIISAGQRFSDNQTVRLYECRGRQPILVIRRDLAGVGAVRIQLREADGAIGTIRELATVCIQI